MLFSRFLMLILAVTIIVLALGIYFKKNQLDDLKVKIECSKNFDYFFKSKIDSFEKVIKTGIYSKSSTEMDVNSLRRCTSKNSFELLQSLIDFENRAFEENSKVTEMQVSVIISKYNDLIIKK